MLFAFGVLASPPSHAATILYEVQKVSGSTWEVSLTVYNDSLTPIEEFSVFFARDRYANLTAAAAPPGWQALAIQPDPQLPDDGFYDSIAIGPGIEPGATLSGFSVRFDLTGAEPPGSQPFQVVQPADLAVRESGTTIPVPDASPPLFLAVAVPTLASLARRRRAHRPPRSVSSAPGRRRDSGRFCRKRPSGPHPTARGRRRPERSHIGPATGILALLASLTAPTLVQGQVSDLVVEDQTLVRSQRISRTRFQYSYRVQVTNRGAADATGVSVSAVSASPHTTVVDPVVVFGDVPAGATAVSTSTLTLEHDRSHPFDWGSLSWSVTTDEVAGDTRSVGPEGGVLSFPNGVTLIIPPGALDAPTQITVRSLSAAEMEGILSGWHYGGQHRYLGGFSATPHLTFHVPVTAIVPVAPFGPYEVAVQLGVDPALRRYSIEETRLTAFPAQGWVEMQTTHFSDVAVGALSGLNPTRLDELCTDPFWNPRVENCEDYDRLQPAACLLREDLRPENTRCCREIEFTSVSAATHILKTASSGDCQVLARWLRTTFPECRLPDGSPAPPEFDPQPGDISPNCDLKEVAELFLDLHYGEKGFRGKLERLSSCSDPVLGELIGDLVALPGVFSSLESLVSFSERECVYQSQTAETPSPSKKCSSASDFAVAARQSLRNRIEELARGFDASCGAGDELAELICIGVASALGEGEWASLLGSEASVFKELATSLFERKECGIRELRVAPSTAFIPTGGRTVLNATPLDSQGGELPHGRKVAWLNFGLEIAEIHPSERSVEVIGLKAGKATIRALDDLSRSAAIAIPVPGAGTLEAAPFLKPFNVREGEVDIGRAVVLRPPESFLLVGDSATLTARLFDASGADITSQARWQWTNSGAGISADLSVIGSDSATVVGTAPGTAIVTIEDRVTGLSATAKIVVGTRVRVSPADLCLLPHEGAQLRASVEDVTGQPLAGVIPEEVVWTSSNDSVASVSVGGTVIAHAPGEAEISATYRNSSSPSAIIRVPSFLDDYQVTPIYAEPTYSYEGNVYPASYELNDFRELANRHREGLEAAVSCGIPIPSAEVPRDVAGSETGFFAYVDLDGRPYLFDADNCAEFEIPIPPGWTARGLVVNETGQVAGTMRTFEPRDLGFLYEPRLDPQVDPAQDASSNPLVTIDPNGTDTVIVDLNNQGQVVGYAAPRLEPEPTRPACFRMEVPGRNFVYDGAYEWLPSGIPGVAQREGDAGICLVCDELCALDWVPEDGQGACTTQIPGCRASDPVIGQEYIRVSGINDAGLVVGWYRYWDPARNRWHVKGFLNDGEYRLIDPPFPLTIPVQDRWSFHGVNNAGDVLGTSAPLAREDTLENLQRFLMHRCPLEEARVLPAP